MTSAPAAPACRARAACRRGARRRRVSPTLPKKRGEGSRGLFRGRQLRRKRQLKRQIKSACPRLGFFLGGGGVSRRPSQTHAAPSLPTRPGTKRCGSASVSPSMKRAPDFPCPPPVPLDPILTTLGRCQEPRQCGVFRAARRIRAGRRTVGHGEG